MDRSIAIGVDRTAAFEDLNEFEHRVDARLFVQGDSKLTGSTAMRGISHERELHRIANLYVVHRRDVVDARALLARVV